MKYKKIMLIDDDSDDQEIFVTALQRISDAPDCEIFSRAQDALSNLITFENLPDAIFLDLNMPVMNGQQFLGEILKYPKLKKLSIIIFSTSNHGPTIQLTKELGASHFITKPNNFDELVNLLRDFLNS